MLFDLRGRGRRRTVQVIYLGLAILMGGGLILFGIGGAGNGGLLDAFNNDKGSVSTSDVFKKRVADAEAAVRLRPTDAKAWADLTRVRYQEAGSGDGFDQTQNTFTDAGIAQLRGAASAWDRYLTLTKTPDPNLAILMVSAFSDGALNEPDKAVSAMEIYLDGQSAPTPSLYVQYATLAYQAGQTRKAQLASDKAIELAKKDTPDDVEQIQAALDAAKQAASTATPATTAAPSG
jgi:hypothetical protein